MGLGIMRGNRLIEWDVVPTTGLIDCPDAEFEAFCSGLPRLQSLELIGGRYWLSVQSTDVNPLRRRIARWLKDNGKQYRLAISICDNVTAFTYDPLDRVISSLTYVLVSSVISHNLVTLRNRFHAVSLHLNHTSQ